LINSLKDADVFYKPEIRQNSLVDGIAAETITKEAGGKIIQKRFMTSLQPNFITIANNLLQLFYINQSKDSINKLLILIRKDNTAKIYSKFPISMLFRAKRDIKKGTHVTNEDVFDIAKLEFRDSIYEINIEKDDKILFLFRIDWKFGLFFDFTKKLDLENLKEELAYYYKRLFYYDLYAFIETEKYFDDLTTDGWFPFIRLIGNNFDKIIVYYKEEKKHNFQINKLINEFTREKIGSFSEYWWKKELFENKKKILEAGINSFLQNNEAGFIACIHTLYPQIEGIMGMDYFKSHGKKPSFQELKRHIKQQGVSKFNTISSLGFPKEFYKYLEKTVFKNFNIATGDLDLSRHTTSHGYANVNDFNKAKALQAILILDQIYFYL